MPPVGSSPWMAFGLSASIASLTHEISELYLADDTPWVIGYSGGKDSTAVTQLVWLGVAGVMIVLPGAVMLYQVGKSLPR